MGNSENVTSRMDKYFPLGGFDAICYIFFSIYLTIALACIFYSDALHAFEVSLNIRRFLPDIIVAAAVENGKIMSDSSYSYLAFGLASQRILLTALEPILLLILLFYVVNFHKKMRKVFFNKTAKQLDVSQQRLLVVATLLVMLGLNLFSLLSSDIFGAADGDFSGFWRPPFGILILAAGYSALPIFIAGLLADYISTMRGNNV